jgi:hypothetical protein
MCGRAPQTGEASGGCPGPTAIADAIESKSKKLPRYEAAVGPVVRLLLVANAILNSGKMRLHED